MTVRRPTGEEIMTEINMLLQKTSRTFALTIPLLPEPTRAEVGLAYLMFRIIDTFEDATLWPATRRVEALNDFVRLLDAPRGEARALADECARRPPVRHAGYLELLGRIPEVLRAFDRLQPGARAIIRAHLARSAAGMCGFIERAEADAGVELETLQDLRDYCYVVAGIVGEMLTDLYLLGRPGLTPVGGALHSRAGRFGEGLQLVNILKDAGSDADEGRVYLPRRVDLREVFMLARSDLGVAAAYTEILRDAGAPAGVVAFNAFIAKLAIANLRLLRDQGPGAKLSRLLVAQIAAEVQAESSRSGPMFAGL